MSRALRCLFLVIQLTYIISPPLTPFICPLWNVTHCFQLGACLVCYCLALDLCSLALTLGTCGPWFWPGLLATPVCDPAHRCDSAPDIVSS